MGYLSIDHLEDFEFHDSNWKLTSREEDTVIFTVENLNIHKDTEQNDEDWDMELSPAAVRFRGFRLIHFEPGRSWTTDESGNSVPAGPRILYTGEKGMAHLAQEAFQVFHLEQEGAHWEFGGCGSEPYFTVEFDFDSVEITWDSYVQKAWYELHRYYTFPVTLDTPRGRYSEKLEITVHEEEVYRIGTGWLPAPSVTARICWENEVYTGDGTDDYLWIDALADLQKKLPQGTTIRGCVSCRYGNSCPYGNRPEEIFCLKDKDISEKQDVCQVFDVEDDVWIKRRKHYFDCCEQWAEMTSERYVYNDFEYHLNH